MDLELKSFVFYFEVTQLSGGTRGIIVIAENQFDKPSSNLGQSCLHFTSH